MFSLNLLCTHDIWRLVCRPSCCLIVDGFTCESARVTCSGQCCVSDAEHFLMASSHREHRQDCLVLSAVWTEFATVAVSFQYIGNRTVLSCLRCERIWEQDATRFTLHFDTGQNCFEISVADSLDLSPFQFTLLTPTRQDKTVLSCPCSWCELAITKHIRTVTSKCQ